MTDPATDERETVECYMCGAHTPVFEHVLYSGSTHSYVKKPKEIARYKAALYHFRASEARIAPHRNFCSPGCAVREKEARGIAYHKRLELAHPGRHTMKFGPFKGLTLNAIWLGEVASFQQAQIDQLRDASALLKRTIDKEIISSFDHPVGKK